MKRVTPLAAVFAVLLCAGAHSEPARTGLHCRITTEIFDGGGKSESGHISNDAGTGGWSGSASNEAGIVDRENFAGQLVELVSLQMTASPTNLNEEAQLPMVVRASHSDGTLSSMEDAVGWSITGPIASITPAGLATAGNVYEDTPARVQAEFDGLADAAQLMIFNVGHDDFGLYAADGVPDPWQVDHFGIGNPEGRGSEDPDEDTQDNLFEWGADLNPTSSASFFAMQIDGTGAATGSLSLVIHPVRPNRQYVPLFSLDLVNRPPDTLPSYVQRDEGEDRIITDTDLAGTPKFYTIRIVPSPP